MYFVTAFRLRCLAELCFQGRSAGSRCPSCPSSELLSKCFELLECVGVIVGVVAEVSRMYPSRPHVFSVSPFFRDQSATCGSRVRGILEKWASGDMSLEH